MSFFHTNMTNVVKYFWLLEDSQGVSTRVNMYISTIHDGFFHAKKGGFKIHKGISIASTAVCMLLPSW
jgi:uncharacterized membrane protein